jgi:hypothetical protein
MTKKMTPSILKLKGSKPNLNLIGIAHHTRGQKVHIGVYSEPKPKCVMKAKIVSKFLGTAELQNLRSMELWKRIGIVKRHCLLLEVR